MSVLEDGFEVIDNFLSQDQIDLLLLELENNGINHVQPPLKVLEQMITFRIHLDDTNEQNGCLKVIPKSHNLGVLTSKQIQQYSQNHKLINCVGNSGSALVMRPHLLHSSSKAKLLSQRRVLHLEYSRYQLPFDVIWK